MAQIPGDNTNNPVPAFPVQDSANADYTSNDGKIDRFKNVSAMIEANGEILPHFPIDQPLTMRNIYLDKINAPFKAIGYEITFQSY